MGKIKQMQNKWKKIPFVVVGISVVMAVMLLLLVDSVTNSQQAWSASVLDLYFEGQYRVGDGDWQPVEAGKHIPATQGDVTVRGRFHLAFPDGEYVGEATAGTLVALYINHIHVTVQEPGEPDYVCDVESAYAGKGMCGVYVMGYELMTDQEITLKFHNPHSFGNENAIDEFFAELAVYADTLYEREMMEKGAFERNVGIVFVVMAFALLGTALFSGLLHIGGSSKMWLVGLCILFAGGYFIYGAKGVFFWSTSVIGNTTILGACMMMYMLCICALIVYALGTRFRKVAGTAVLLLGVSCMAFALYSFLPTGRFYDTWLWWVVIQSAVNVVLLVCIGMNFAGASKIKIAGNIGAAILLLGFEADLVGTVLGWWQGGLVCKHIFVVMAAVVMVLIWLTIPQKINAARKAEEMEADQKIIRAQLQENRIAIMISQIQPHFIYNTLGTIQQLCKEDPEQAAKLVHRFSLYLRGNFSELDNARPIRFAQELDHVRCYTDIELVRFQDITVRFDIQAEEFLLPALSVQPLVENAIKHGLMGLESGGTVTVSSYETDTHYCIQVVDDGVGFDVSDMQYARKRVGIRNVRERLQVMCGGSLILESEPGKGTKAQILIPKEAQEE